MAQSFHQSTILKTSYSLGSDPFLSLQFDKMGNPNSRGRAVLSAYVSIRGAELKAFLSVIGARYTKEDTDYYRSSEAVVNNNNIRNLVDSSFCRIFCTFYFPGLLPDIHSPSPDGNYLSIARNCCCV